MIKSKKQMFLVIGVFALVMLLGTVTYAFFNYTRTGVANTIKVGRISFVTRELDTINLTNVFPISSSEATGENPNYGEVVIEIVGDTDYTGGIEYLVSAVDASIYTNQGQIVPISLDIKIDDDLGTENNNYFTVRDNTNSSIYKRIVGNTLLGDQMLLVGYIAPNSVSGTPDGIDATVTIKAYLDKDKILISDTYDGNESDNMGTSNSMAQGKTVLTTPEWNALQQNGVSFKVKVEANEGIWVNGSLEEIMKKDAVMDNINSDYVDNTTPGINFGAVSSDTNGKGVYMRAGTENDTYPIMYYRGEVNDNNVVFANKCWKAVRTTDTGGVKLIYNGETQELFEEIPLAESTYTKDTTNTDSRWTFDSSDSTWNISIEDNTQPAIEFTVPQGDNYTLVMTGTSGSSCGGSFSFYKNGTSVKSVFNGGGAAMDLTYSFGSLTSSDTIKMNYSGSSSSTCPITFKLKMVENGEKIADNICNNTSTDTYISVSGENNFVFNEQTTSPAYVGYMYGTVFESSAIEWTSNARFGSSFTWNGTNYTLVDDTVTSPNATHHYSCNVTTESGTCTDLRYVYYVSGSTKYYITLTGGDGIEEALTKMQTNTTNSNAKDKIDTWYASNLATYTNKLEDTIWCNDRSIGRANGWSATGAWGTSDYKEYSLLFGAGERSNDASNTSTVKNQPSLACVNKNDRFTVNNTNGNLALTYPIALLTEDEMIFAGGVAGEWSMTFYLNDGTYYSYWSMSPSCWGNYLDGMFSVVNNQVDSININVPLGLRPVVSIKLGQLITKGTGTVTDPYVIE